MTNLYNKGLTRNMRTYNKRYHSVGLSNTVLKQLEAGKRNFQNDRVNVKYKLCLSVTLIVAVAALLLRSACCFLVAKLQEMLISA